MIKLTFKTRLGLLALYLGLMLLAVVVSRILFLYFNGAVHPVVGVLAIRSHALPLLVTKFIEDLLFGGPEPTGKGGLILLAIVAVQWWPFAVLSAFPRLWTAPVMRKVIIGYLATVLILDVGAAVWLIMDPSLLAG